MIPRNSRLRKKVRVMVAMLLLLAAWPIVHRTLVVRHGVNPWKLYGWAMYCVPKFQTRLQFLGNLRGREDSEPQPIRYPMQVDGAAQTLRSYRFWESGIGGLASTEALAAVLFNEFPAMGRVSIRIYKTRFDVETAMLVAESSWSTHDRPGGR